MELIDRCLAKVDRFMSLGVHFGPFQQGATEAHLAIVDAIARRDPNAARTRMEEHLDCGSRLMKEALLRGQLTHVGVVLTAALRLLIGRTSAACAGSTSRSSAVFLRRSASGRNSRSGNLIRVSGVVRRRRDGGGMA